MTVSTPSRFGSLNDHDPFHIPIPGLFADMDAASGCVALTDEFLEAAPQVRHSVLQQWLRSLNAHKDSALVEMFRDHVKHSPAPSIVGQIESFRHHCSREGFTCPSDFAVLLQRY